MGTILFMSVMVVLRYYIVLAPRDRSILGHSKKSLCVQCEHVGQHLQSSQVGIVIRHLIKDLEKMVQFVNNLGAPSLLP